VFRLLTYRNSTSTESQPLDEGDFSVARYQPMARLMSDEDLQFLKSQPGYRPEIGKKFSRERRRVFRLYLQELARDFHRLHAHARSIAATLPADHSPLVGMLIRQQVRFWYEMTAIEMRLSLGMTAGSIHAKGLLDALAAMQLEVSRLGVATA
jgi:hypothetical protein